MPLTGLTAAADFARDPRFRGRDRRAPPDRAPKPAETTLAPPDEAARSLDAAFLSSRFKSDLSGLRAFEGAAASAEPPDREAENQLADFFGHLGALLAAVRAGDISRAQSAADALELDALVEHNGAGEDPVLGDLVALFAAARALDEAAAQAAALRIADDARPVFAPAPDGYGEDGGAAYDTLAQFLEGDAATA